jgi:hypothetical protein
MRPFSIGAASLMEAATNSAGACAHKPTAVSSPATISLCAIGFIIPFAPIAAAKF